MTAAIMPRLFRFSSRKPNFGFDLLGRDAARTLMHVLEERFQGLPAGLLALRLINSERGKCWYSSKATMTASGWPSC